MNKTFKKIDVYILCLTNAPAFDSYREIWNVPTLTKTVVKKLLSRRRKKISTTTTAAVSTLSCLWSGPPEPALVLDCLDWTVTGATECTQSSHRHGHVVQCDRCFVLCTKYLITFVFKTLRSSRGLAAKAKKILLLRSSNSNISFGLKKVWLFLLHHLSQCYTKEVTYQTSTTLLSTSVSVEF